MTRRSSKLKSIKPRQTESHENVLSLVLMGLCLGIVALRCTITESPTLRLTTEPSNLFDSAYSLTLTMVLLLAAGIWGIYVLQRKTRVYKTYLGAGISLFILGGLISACFASDQRSAVSHLMAQVAPMAMAWLLVQVLNTPAKIRLTLASIAVLGLLTSFESHFQYSGGNQDSINDYEEDPAPYLNRFNLTPGTLNHFLFEHRLYSKGVSGFFTTRNSNGSFLLIAILASLALTVEGVAQYKQKQNGLAYPVAALLVTLINLNFLIITKSKGALGGLALACLGLITIFVFCQYLRAHVKRVAVISILAVIIITSSLIYYGQTHDTLPGGNSLLVRWQYWQATVQMIAQHPWVGVGPGNFAQAYHEFKPWAAPESVADPHNVILSLLSQYGPLGLAGFVLAFSFPLIKAIPWQRRAANRASNTSETSENKIYWGTILGVCTMLLLAKSMMDMGIEDPGGRNLALFMCIFHALILYVGMVVLLLASAGDNTKSGFSLLHWTVPVLACCILGLWAANMIDFALFEPGVLASFWTLVACLVSTHHIYAHATPPPVQRPIALRRYLTGTIVAILLGCGAVGYVPVLAGTSNIRRANQAWADNDTAQAHQALDRAAHLDWLSDTALYQNAGFCLHEYKQSPKADAALLEKARACLNKAIRRNPGAYRNYERLADVCAFMDPNTAVAPAEQAVGHYPGSARLRVKLARIYDQLGQRDQALEAYRTALDIEDQFQKQFKAMYPEEPLIHRLEKAYLDTALEALKRLEEDEKIRN